MFSDGQCGCTFEFRFKVKYSYQGHDREQSPRQQSSMQKLREFGISDPILGSDGGNKSLLSSPKLSLNNQQARDNISNKTGKTVNSRLQGDRSFNSVFRSNMSVGAALSEAALSRK